VTNPGISSIPLTNLVLMCPSKQQYGLENGSPTAQLLLLEGSTSRGHHIIFLLYGDILVLLSIGIFLH
jgi:hypothetical protein